MQNQKLLIEGAAQMGIRLSEKMVRQFSIFYDLLMEWNQKLNLTTVTGERDVIVRHFLDSLAGVPFFAGQRKPLAADIGTGAGLPGVPLAIVFPEVPFILLDSLQKRLTFLQEAAEQMDLKNVHLIHGRAEEFAHKAEYREKFTIVTARALAPLPVLLEYCMGYARPGGIVLAYKGPSLEAELPASANALAVLKGKVESARVLPVPYSDFTHRIAVIRKTAALEQLYPRPQAKIKKAPL